MADLRISQNFSSISATGNKKQMKRITYLSLVPVFALLLLVAMFGMMGVLPTFAQVQGPWYVTVDGEDDASCLFDDPCSLETAVFIAKDGEEIRVASGTYIATAATIPVLALNESLTVTGGYNANWNLEPDLLANKTVLDGEGSHRVISITAGASPNISNFHIENGSAVGQFGAGIFIEIGNGQPHIHNNNINNNSAGSGGGIYDGAGALIEYNEIYSNSANSTGGAGILIDNIDGITTTIQFNKIYLNRGADGAGGGGLMLLDDGAQAKLVANEIFDNSANYGGGVATFSDTELTLFSNMIITNSTDTYGGGLYALGDVSLWNNTFADNDATQTGGGFYVNSGNKAEISNNIVAFNTGSGFTGIEYGDSTPSITGTKNMLYNNTNNIASSIDLTDTLDPEFVNPANLNFHIEETSPARNEGTSPTPGVDIDIDEQPRPNSEDPNGVVHDIGADEYYEDFAEFELLPAIDSNTVERESSETFAHYLHNTGTVSDTYSFTCSSDIFTVTYCSPPIQILAGGSPVQITTSVEIPADRTPYEVGQTMITATSNVSPTLSDLALVFSTIAPRPNIMFTPNYSRTELPGDVITLTHAITNTGDAFENFIVTEIDDDGDPNWGELQPTDPYTIGIGSGEVGYVQVRITIPEFAPQGLANYVHLQASSEFDPSVSATVFNTITAKATVGTRYVVKGGDDTDNNCTQSNKPCGTIKRAVGQAVSGDEIQIGYGEFQEADINVNDTIHISGGWEFFREDGQGEEPNPEFTKIDAQGNGPIFVIGAGDPTISVLTMKNGQRFNGGGVFVSANTRPEFSNVVFENNTATNQGGAIYANGSGTVVTVQKGQFSNNSTVVSTGSGGAVYMDGGILSLNQSQFMTSTTGSGGGGALTINNNAQLTAQNNLFYNSSTSGNGGGVRLNNGSANFNFNTWVANDATGNGGGVYNNNATVTIQNSIFATNTATIGSAVFENAGSTTLDYLNLWNNTTNVADEGSNSFIAEPKFADEFFRLDDGSPAIDVANSINAPNVDFEDDARPTDEGHDIGYDERAGCRTQRADVVYGSIQAAVDVNDEDNLIKVSGICRGVHTIDVGGVPISQTVHLTKSVVIQGGWDSEFEKQYVDPTLVDPEDRGRAFYITDGVSVTIEGLTVTNGSAVGLGGGPTDEDAGGIFYNVDGNVTLKGVRIFTGTAELGGGFYNHSGTPLLTWEMHEGEDEEIYTFSEIANGSADSGAGVYNNSGAMVIDGAWLHHNQAANNGGGLFNADTMTVANTILDSNSAAQGGGLYNEAATASYLHMTVYNNTAVSEGGGVYNAAGQPILASNIFESNQASDGAAVYDAANATVDYNYYYLNNVAGNAVTGTHSIETNTIPPGLIDPAIGDFHIFDDAPAVDKGDPLSPIPTDFEDDQRPSSQGFDMGADEIAGCLAQLNDDEIFGSLQAAIDAAEIGDEIKVSGTCSGVHQYDSGIANACGDVMQTGVHIDKDLTITGGWDEEFSEQEEGAYSVLDANGLGRVMYIGQGISATVEGFEMINGVAVNGAGVCIDEAEPTLHNNRIYSNTATNGGGLYLISSGSITATLQNNFIYRNIAVDGAGAYNESGNSNIWHNTFYGNIASGNGGAFYNDSDTPDIRGNIFMANVANIGSANSGGAIYAVTEPTVDFNDYFENDPFNFGGTISDGGANSIYADPGFYNIISDVFTITIDSPVVDFDIPNMPLLIDFEGDPRPSHQGYDMGADEVGGCFAAFQHDVTNVYGSVQLAVDLINDGGTVLVDGICQGVNSRTVAGNLVTQGLVLTKSVTIDGSWDYDGDTSTVTTTIDAVDSGRVVYVDNGATVTITNIIMRQGNANGAGNSNNGGGVYNEGFLSISDAWIQESTAVSGGGIYNESVLLVDNTGVLTNTVTQDGGGLYNNTVDGIQTTIQGSEFRNNLMGDTGDGGGGIFHQAGTIMVNGNRIHRNGYAGSPGGDGGGIYLNSGTSASVDVRNNFIYYNLANEGGGLYNANTNGRLWHNTFYGNIAIDFIGGGLASVNGSPDIRNNIVHNNDGYGIYTQNGTPIIDYNNAVNNTAGNIFTDISIGSNNISDPPTYVSVFDENFHLAQGSRGEDEGDPDVSDDTNTYYVDDDIDGHMRPTNSGPDMGADEIDSCRVRVGDQIFSVLQDAIDYAESTTYNTAEIARGECRGTFLNEATGTRQVAYISEDIEIIGSLRRIDFGGDDFHHPDIGTNTSIINANNEGRVFHIADNVVISMTHIAIVNGNGFAADATANDDGGGVYNPGGSAHFNQVFICNNIAQNGAGYYGGSGSASDMTGTTIGTCFPAQVTEDPADGSIIVVRPVYGLEGNEAENHGGGAYLGGDADLRNMAIWENQSGLSGSGGHGGGIYNGGTNNRLVNNYFNGNIAASSTSDGGGLYNTGAELRVLHNTLRNNYAGDQGGGIFNGATDFELNSSIIYTNTSVNGDGGLHYSQAPALITHNNFNDNSPRDPAMDYGATHFTWDPKLRGFGLWHYSLSVNSPNIDQAYEPLKDEVNYDIDQNYRPDGNPLLTIPPHGQVSDIGADEYIKDFGCEIDPDEETREVSPGSTITYTLRIINVGNPPYTADDYLVSHGYTDTITITLSSQTQGWSTLEGGEVQTVELGWDDRYPNGDWTTRVLTVTVPEGTQSGRGETTVILCESRSRPEMSNTATINTDVGLTGGVQVIPDVSRSVVSGEVITIEQTIINLQNQAAEYLLTPSPGPRHASATLLESGTLSPTDNITVSLTPYGTAGYSTTALLEVTILNTAVVSETANPGLVATHPLAQNASIHQFEIMATPGTRYVADTGQDTTNCKDLLQPCATIQHAIEQAVAGDEIRVAAGTYTDYVTRTVGVDNFQQNVFIDKSLTIAGGYLATGDDPFTVQGPVTAITNAVVLDGQGVRRVIYVTDGISATLSGLIIQDGNSNGDPSMNGNTREFGGGIYNEGADLTIYSSWIQDNTSQYGAGVFHADGLLTMYSNILSGNGNPPSDGTYGEGGGLYLADGEGIIENNTFADNFVDQRGSGPVLNAISAAPTGFGAGIFLDEPSEATVTNNIFSWNDAVTGTAIYISSTATLTNSYNLYVPVDAGNDGTIANGSYGSGSILTDTAGFEGLVNGNMDYHIRVDSPAKDVGTDSVSISQTVDIDLEQRIMGVEIDIGADERTQRPGFVFEPAVLSATIDTGDVFTYYHWITNTGDFEDSYSLEMFNQVTPAGDGTWSYDLQPPTIDNLAPLASVQVTLVVTGGQPGYVDMTTITATSKAMMSLSASVEDTTTITQDPGVEIAESESGVGVPGELITYTHTLTNTGNGLDEFTLTGTAVPADWTYTISPTQPFFVAAGESVPFTVTVLIPADAISSTQHQVVVTATVSNPDDFDVLTDTTTVGLVSGLLLTPDNTRSVPDGTSTVYTHTLTSNSNIVDTITLTATGTLAGWGVALEPESVVMNPLESRTISVTVTVPPDTGGLTHYTYVTATSTLPDLVATATNTTTVPVETGISFTPNLTETVYAGSMAYYTHTLTNLGNLTDTFNIISNSVEGWIYDITAGPLEVGPGASVQVTAVISVPLGTPPATIDTLTITATSQADGATSATVTDTTQVVQFVALTFIPDHEETGDAGTTKTYTHTLTNDGDGSDTFDLTYSGDPSWAVTFEPPTAIVLDVGETAVVTATLTIPGAAFGITNTTYITATSQTNPSISASVVDITKVLGDRVNLGVLLEPDRFAIGNLSETITYYHTVTNTGEAMDDLALFVASSVYTTTVEPETISNLAVGASAPVTVTVTIPAATAPGDEDMAVITAVSQSDPDVSSSVTDTTRVLQTHGLLFFPDNAQTTDPDTTVYYQHTLQNTGDAPDTFTIVPNSSSGWTTAVDSPVILDANESTTVYITLTVPAGTDGDIDVMQVTASSIISPAYTLMVTNTTTINVLVPPVAGVEIEPDHEESAVAGDVIEYVHIVTNTGDESDTFTVNAVSSLRWTPIVAPASLTLGAGETGQVTVTVTVPNDINAGARDETTVTVTSQSDPAVTDFAVDTTTVPGLFLPIILKSDAGVVEPTPTPPGPTATPGCTTPTGVDLIVEDVWIVPGSPNAGVPAVVFVTIKNQGTVSVAPNNNFYVDFYVDQVPARYLIGAIEWGVQGEWVQAGQSYTLSGSYAFSGGTHELWAQVDTDNTVNECPFENNNEFGPISLTVSGTNNAVGQEGQLQQAQPNDGPRQTPTPDSGAAGLPDTNVEPVMTERPLSTPTPTTDVTPAPP